MSAAQAALSPETEIPEADRVAGFLHPRETAGFFGHGKAERQLRDAWASGRLPHAWLLTGAPGVGKATLAYRFARFLLANPHPGAAEAGHDLSVPPASTVFRQVAGLAHPDLLVLRRPWQAQRKRHATAITVDEARRLRAFLGQTAASGGWRVVIVDSADDLNIAAVNALLKSLEEPPEACVFLLVSAAPGRLPVTIRSRCRTLRLAPLADDAMREALAPALEAGDTAMPTADALEDVLSLAQGSPGAALRLIANDGADLYRRLLRLLDQLPGPDYAAVHELADVLGAAGAEERHELFHMMLGGLIARLVAHGVSGEGAVGEETGLAARLVTSANLAQWASLWETLQRAKAEADALNLDRKILVLEMFFRLEKAARGEAD